MDSSSRSIVKAISYRIVGSASTALICFVLTGNPALSFGAGLLDTLIKTGIYFAHERLWNHIPYGRQRPPEYEI